MKRSKQFLACLIACSAMTLAAPSVQATGAPVQDAMQDAVITPRFQHLSRISSSLTFSALGRANCGGSFTTYDEYDSSMTMVLQQFKNQEWVDIKTWSGDFTGSGVKVLDKGYYVPSGYRYRLVVTVTIWDSKGNALEIASCDSPIQEY